MSLSPLFPFRSSHVYLFSFFLSSPSSSLSLFSSFFFFSILPSLPSSSLLRTCLLSSVVLLSFICLLFFSRSSLLFHLFFSSLCFCVACSVMCCVVPCVVVWHGEGMWTCCRYTRKREIERRKGKDGSGREGREREKKGSHVHQKFAESNHQILPICLRVGRTTRSRSLFDKSCYLITLLISSFPEGNSRGDKKGGLGLSPLYRSFLNGLHVSTAGSLSHCLPQFNVCRVLARQHNTQHNTTRSHAHVQIYTNRYQTYEH